LGAVLGAALFAGVGLVLVAGPLVAWIIGALEGAVVVLSCAVPMKKEPVESRWKASTSPSSTREARVLRHDAFWSEVQRCIGIFAIVVVTRCLDTHCYLESEGARRRRLS
jgi:hypothetical protein